MSEMERILREILRLDTEAKGEYVLVDAMNRTYVPWFIYDQILSVLGE